MNIEERLEEVYNELKEEFELDSIEEVKETMIEEWGDGADRGYAVFMEDYHTPRGIVIECINRIDEYMVYDGDDDAAAQAEADGFVKLLHWEFPESGNHDLNIIQDTIIDTPENRKVLEKYRRK